MLSDDENSVQLVLPVMRFSHWYGQHFS